ncbi:MAG TPA: hypothetical protein VNJ01_15575 [Bacteriovoracaceae bacterium]|nr:hypothetical protein [Bacteriovoracaceae bacterium]
MNLIQVGLIVFILSIFSSCATRTAGFASSEENGWFLEATNNGDSYPIYCMANKGSNTAAPACFKAEKKNFNEWKEKVRGD